MGNKWRHAQSSHERTNPRTSASVILCVSTLFRDLRIGLRVLIREKSFCALAVTVLALGICGVTAMFSVVNGVMLRGFSFPNADRLVAVNFIDPTSRNAFGVNGQIFTMDYEEFKPAQKSFDMMSAYLDGSTVNVSYNSQARRYTGAYVTEDFLRILGVSPFQGRDFVAADNVEGAAKVALIGYGMWQRDFGAAPNIVGTAVRINGKPATVIGVMPKGFAFPTNEEIWLPLYGDFPPRPRTDPNANAPSVLALLKRGVSLDQASAEATGFAQRLSVAYPQTNKAFTTGQVQMLITAFTPIPLRATMWTMLGCCGGVLLIACVNVMNMQFARATLRAKELAIRSSLGAGRLRLIRQMLTESLLLSAIGAAIGIALAYAAISWLDATVRNLDNPPPSWIVFDMDPKVLFVTVSATVIAAVASGLLPAWMSSRTSSIAVLRDGSRGTTSRSVSVISRGLVILQIVVTCVLLIGSILQARSIVNQQNINYGYDTTGIMSARMALMDGDYPSPDARKIFFDRLLLQLRDDQSFSAVAFTNRFRMVFSGNTPIELPGKVYATNKDRSQANFEQVTAGYFDVTGQKILQGRGFTDEDLDTRQPVAIVNAAFAEKHFGRDNPIGRQFRSSAADGTNAGAWRTIVGEVTTTRMIGPFNNPGVDESGYYVPFYASPTGPPLNAPLVTQFATIAVRPRAGQDVESARAALRRAVMNADPNLPLYFMGTPKSQIDGFVAQNRIIATMFSIFGVVAIVLASVGIYGVMSFSVNQRRQEFGVRMALGADTGGILSLVMKQGVIQIAIGLAVGIGLTLAAAFALGDALQTTLFGVKGTDPLTYISVGLLVTVVSLSASFIPARRAAKVDPNVALRAS
jgi:putative ABC transport system permease protein